MLAGYHPPPIVPALTPDQSCNTCIIPWKARSPKAVARKPPFDCSSPGRIQMRVRVRVGARVGARSGLGSGSGLQLEACGSWRLACRGPQETGHALARERDEDDGATAEPAAEPRRERREEQPDDLLRHEDRADGPMPDASVCARTREEGRDQTEGEVGERLGQDDDDELEPLAMGACAIRVAHLPAAYSDHQAATERASSLGGWKRPTGQVLQFSPRASEALALACRSARRSCARCCCASCLPPPR
eukprot:scaffold132741_cov57-Phaeocystis_antarctica.AAC.2